jgi:hypothetical protein
MTMRAEPSVSQAIQLRHALTGTPFPARRWQLLSWAVHNGASHLVQDRLHKLPDRLYRDPSDVFGQVRELTRNSGTWTRPAPPAGALAS